MNKIIKNIAISNKNEITRIQKIRNKIAYANSIKIIYANSV